LHDELVAVDPQFETDAPPTPNDLVNFGRIDQLPVLLAGLLAALATITVAHLLLSSVRRRRRDLAILKTLGFDRRQVRATIAWQASAVTLVAATIAMPLGAASGRTIWGVFARSLGVVPAPVTPVLVLVAIVPAAIVLANLVAIAPGAVAARVLPAAALREQ
jgi:putative ABC transport system permease protein